MDAPRSTRVPAVAPRWTACLGMGGRHHRNAQHRRYGSTHPDNPLAADAPEAEWNARLHAPDDARHEPEERRADDPTGLDDVQRHRILLFANDFPRLGQDPATPDRERKRMARPQIRDVTITRSADIAPGIGLPGGQTRELHPAPEPRRRNTRVQRPWPPATARPAGSRPQLLTDSRLPHRESRG